MLDQASLGEKWALARAMADSLEQYLDQEMVFMPIFVPGPEGFRRRTVSLGSLFRLLAYLRDHVNLLTPGQAGELNEMERKAEELRRLKPEPYWRKARREVQSHLNSLKWFLDDVEKRERRDKLAQPGEASHYWQMKALLDHARAHGRTELEDLQQSARSLEEPVKAFLTQGNE